MRLALAFIKRDFLIAISYKLAFAMQLGRILLIVPCFYYLGSMVQLKDSGGAEAHNGAYFPFLLVGVAFAEYVTLSLKTFNESLRESQLMGTLEIILLSPTSLAKLLAYSSLWNYLFTSARVLMYLLVGVLFGLDLSRADYLSALLILVVAIISFAAFGILVASVTMVIKKGEVLNGLIGAASVLLGGVIFPTEALPAWAQRLADYLPITHALEGIRRALFAGQGVLELLPQLTALTLFAVVLFPLGVMTFTAAVHWTKKTGTISHY